MEFDFNVNALFPDTISLITRDSVAGKIDHQRSKYQKNLETVIDELGRKSALAQSLSAPITYLQKSLFNGHHLYVLKDSQDNNGLGTVIGFLKVGKKRLFLLDHFGNQNEIYPLCVLDFYVHESHQRRGCGLQLFNRMLQVSDRRREQILRNLNPVTSVVKDTECVKAIHLAIDRPSYKFLSFLKKHFKISQIIPQVNNFVIFEGFFDNRSDIIRTSVTNERFDNSRFRPLSRAVSDDVIRRHRETQVAKNHSNFTSRPISGFSLSPNDEYSFYPTRNNRRRRWNADGFLSSQHEQHSAVARNNFYSRFAHERSASPRTKPSLPPIEVISHHTCEDKFSKDTIGEPAEGEKITNGIIEHNVEKILPTAEAEGFRKPQSEAKVFNHMPNSGFHSHSASLYKKPSDMLQELREKDERTLREAVSGRSHQRQRSTHLNGRTAWNIFGVPIPKQWTLK